MDNKSDENKSQADKEALAEMARKFILDAVSQVVEKGNCEVIADVHVTVSLKLSKKNSDTSQK